MGERGSMGAGVVRLTRFGGENGWRRLGGAAGAMLQPIRGGAGPAELGLGDPWAARRSAPPTDRRCMPTICESLPIRSSTCALGTEYLSSTTAYRRKACGSFAV